VRVQGVVEVAGCAVRSEPGVSGVRLKGRDCQMTAASGLCWLIGTSQHHKANFSSKDVERTACLHSCTSTGLKSGTLLHGRVGL
jgi:hypothetical protein